MNYLLFVYYDNTIEDSEIITNEIGLQISDHMTSKEVKFMFGDKHAIFHFSSNLDMAEMGGWIDIIHDGMGGFQYFLTTKPRNSASNMPKDNLDHLLSLKKSKTKKTPPVFEPRKKFTNFDTGKEFMDIADLILNLKRPEVCNLTLDELLDKMVDQGIESLSEIERNKLEEYSKSI
jgi:hypothetical protein